MTNHVLYPSNLPSAKFETHNKIIGAAAEEQPLSPIQNGFLKGKLIVADHLPLELAQGAFVRPLTHEVMIRLASLPDARPSSAPGMTITFPGVDTFKLSAVVDPDVGVHQRSHPMDEEYVTQAPFRFGDRAATLRIIPSGAGLLALKSHPFNPATPEALRQATIAFFHANPAEFEVKVQLDMKSHAERKSAYQTVARLVIPSQNVTERASDSNSQPLSFSAVARARAALRRLRHSSAA